MPLLRVYHNGVTLSTYNEGRRRIPPVRTAIKGWSRDAARRNIRFLWSVDAEQLTGHGVALSLTLRDLPASRPLWTQLVKRWIDRQLKRDLIRLHWVCEWQRRGVPHLHVAAWYRSNEVNVGGWGELAIRDWLQLAEGYGAKRPAQHGEEIKGVLGWFRYVAKHAARGVEHYQRQAENLPESWQGSGRLWGYRGEWPTERPVDVELTGPEAARLRRLVCRWLVSQARSWHETARGGRVKGAPGGIRWARRWGRRARREDILKAAAWIPERVALQLVAAARQAERSSVER